MVSVAEQTVQTQAPANQRTPLVSVGMPVRNGQKYICQALDSILNQTLTDIEVVICDNDSTDDTQSICQGYVARDPRVRYFRNEQNLGPAGNHNRCFSHAIGKYFKWHAHDDLIAPTFLEKCVAVLENDPKVVNSHSFTDVIDENNNHSRDYTFRAATDHEVPSRRFGSLIHVNHKTHVGYEIFGVWRREELAKTPLEKADAHGDRILLVRMVLRGKFHEVPEKLFLARAHATQSMAAKSKRGRLTAFIGGGPLPPAEWWDASKKGKIVFPEWNLLAEYWSAIQEVPELSAGNRWRSRFWLALWTIRNSYKLVRDLILAAEHALLHREPQDKDGPKPQHPSLPKSDAERPVLANG